MHNRLSSHLENLELLDVNQGGFGKKHSTLSTIAKLTDSIFEGINNRNITIACFIDMAKAFDTVNHCILCKQLDKLGIRGHIGNWLKNYLIDRKQCTLANGIISSFHNITCGVPQGSTLGPLSFIIYMNDIKSSCTNSQYLLYADDTVIFNTKELALATSDLQSDLNAIKT